MPVSAYTCCGFSVSDTEHFIYKAASNRNAKYLHLCEASPSQHPNGPEIGATHVGQVISALVNSYLLAKESECSFK